MDLEIQIYCGGTLLADGSDAGGVVEDLTVNGSRVIQEAQPLRADWITVFGRGNRKNTVSFIISVVQASLTAALLAQLQQGDLLPDQADLIINFTENGSTTSIRIAGAGWNPIECKTTGKSTMTKFTVIGGQCLVTAGVGVPGIDGGNADSDYSLANGWPVDGGCAADRQYENGYAIDGGNA